MTRRADICLVVEGAFPYLVGGVSSWLMDLMAGQSDICFHVVAIKADERSAEWRLQPPANVTGITEIALQPRIGAMPIGIPRLLVLDICNTVEAMLEGGGLHELKILIELLQRLPANVESGSLMAEPEFFILLRRQYERTMSSTSFHHFFWAWRSLVGGLFSILLAPMPAAGAYHTISTGYAGLFAARARAETGRPAFLTEHGIYQLEREIEIMMAQWLGNQVDTGLSLARDATDVRDLWIGAFKSYARACYEACNPVIALYAANNMIQERLGAATARLRTIPNGVDVARYAALPDNRDPAAPTVALIGRVVEIKDVKTYIRAIAIVHRTIPAAQFLLLGPTEEDAAYAAECFDMVRQLGLESVLTFTGKVRIDDWLPKIALIVLTSLSEAQPLVILEAGAAGIPIVTPDVGCCRELVEGKPGEDPPIGEGGIVTPLVNPEATAAAIIRLLQDDALRRTMGENLKQRIATYYSREAVLESYNTLYHRLSAMAA